MASKYWIKLYHEVLDDPKIGRLRVALKWRFIECLLVAGDDGILPQIDDMAWRVRADVEELETDLNELSDAGLLNRVAGDWQVNRGIGPEDRIRRELSQSKKRKILKRDNHICQYCGGEANQVDHIIPVSQGGTNKWSNLAAACWKCNRSKWDRTPAQWIADKENRNAPMA